MALTLKVLAAAALGTTANTVIYSPPSGKSAVLNSIFITNETGSAVTIHAGVRMAGVKRVKLEQCHVVESVLLLIPMEEALRCLFSRHRAFA